MGYSVYVLYSAGFDKYYIGQTNDTLNRLAYHNGGFSASTRPYRPWKIVCSIQKASRREAMELERKLKNLNREKLKAFIVKNSD
jgi:putative endonuclease